MIPKRKSTLQFSLPTLTVGGVCAGTWGDVYYNWPASPTPCTMFNGVVLSGLCSEQTESALLQQDCINTVWSLPRTARRTIEYMVQSMCRQEVFDNFQYRPLPPACASDCITVLTTSGTAIFEDPVNCLSDCPATVSPNTNTISSPNYPDSYSYGAHFYYQGY